MEYREVVRRLEKKGAPFPEGSEAERQAVERFQKLLRDFKAPDFAQRVREVYAEDLFFNDTLKTITQVSELEPYLVASGNAVEVGTVEFLDRAVTGGNYYFRWEMSLQFKKLRKGVLNRSQGMTHVRFDAEGKVVLHQDFWDSATGFFDHVPVVGRLIGAVRSRV